MRTGVFYSANALKKLVMAVFRYPAAAVLWFLVFPLSIISDVFFFFFPSASLQRCTVPQALLFVISENKTVYFNGVN